MTAGRYDILAEHRARTVAEKAEQQIEQLSTSVEDLHTQITQLCVVDCARRTPNTFPMKVTITRGTLQLTLDECSANDLIEVLRALPAEPAPVAPITWPVAPTLPYEPWQPYTPPGTVIYRTTTGDRTS